MTQGDGFRDDECDCGACDIRSPLEGYISPTEGLNLLVVDVAERQKACIEDLLGIVGYLPEANAILAKHGLL